MTHVASQASQPQGLRQTTIGTGLLYVNIHGSTGKVDEATGLQIRSHLMKEYHKVRRSQRKRNNSSALVDNTSSRQLVSPQILQDCGYMLPMNNHIQSSDLTAWPEWSHEDDLALLPHLRQCTCFDCSYQSQSMRNAVHQEQVAPFSRRVLGWPQGTFTPTQVVGLSNLGNIGRFDPFASSAIPLTSRMGEAIHYCQPFHALSDLIRETLADNLIFCSYYCPHDKHQSCDIRSRQPAKPSNLICDTTVLGGPGRRSSISCLGLPRDLQETSGSFKPR
jgi:hypothetical protein